MSENKDNGDTEVIEFEELKAEETEESSKEEQLATFLKNKLSEEDFGAAAKILGVDAEDLSNAELLEKLTELLQGKKEEEPEEKKPEEEKEMMDYKEYMKACMAEGKSMEECQAEFKKKYPDAKEEAAEPEVLAKPGDDPKLAALNDRVAELEGKLELEKISTEVAGLVTDKHLSPKQVAPVTKLGAGMTPEMRADFLNLFRTTQKFTVSEDKGMLLSKRPGEPDTIDAETRTRLLKEHGIADLIAEKGVRRNN